MIVVVALLAFLVVIGGIVTTTVVLARRANADATRRRERFEALLGAVGRGGPIVRHGRTFVLGYTAAGRNGPETLTIDVQGGRSDDRIRNEGEAYRSPATPMVLERYPILLRRETATDRAGKRLGLNREAQTGDADFDARIYLETEAPDAWVREVLAASETRRAVLDLSDRGMDSVWLNATAATIRILQKNPRPEDFSPVRFEELAAVLDRLATGLPHFRRDPVRTPLPRGAKLIGASVLATIAGIGWVIASSKLWPPVDDGPALVGLASGLLAWLVTLPLAGRVVRGRFDGLRDLFFVAGFALVALPLLAVSSVKTVNGLLDPSLGSTHRVRVAGLRKTGSKSTSYYARVESWRAGEATLELGVPSDVYFGLAVNGSLAITTHPGALGWEWISALDPIR